MGVVTWMVETTDNFLDDAAQTTFGNVAGQLGGVLAVASTLAVIGVFLNMVFQYKSMDGRTAFWFALKLMLISLCRSTPGLERCELDVSTDRRAFSKPRRSS